MITRYAIINVEDRDNFEKEWQLPYGYNNCYVNTDLGDTIDEFRYYYDGRHEGYIIEKIDEYGREVIEI